MMSGETTYHPWRDLATRHPGVRVGHHDLRPARGAWIPCERVILLDSALARVERRCVLAHEVAHIDLGHQRSGRRWFDRRQERDADDLAARRLVNLDALADALRWALSPAEAADELDVTVDVVRRRVRALTSVERDYIEGRIAAEGVA